jgi:hypothetical protein
LNSLVPKLLIWCVRMPISTSGTEGSATPRRLRDPSAVLVVKRSQTTVTVWGNVSELAGAADAYEVHDYRLSENSSCTETGQNQDWMREAVDLDGNTRVMRATAEPPVPTMDTRAYEHDSFAFQIVDVNPTGGSSEDRLEIIWNSLTPVIPTLSGPPLSRCWGHGTRRRLCRRREQSPPGRTHHR